MKQQIERLVAGLILFVGVLVSNAVIVSTAAAQYGYGPPGPTVDMISNYSILPSGQEAGRPGAGHLVAVGGTAFPWFGRTGNEVTLSGSVSISGPSTITVENITVELDEHPCYLQVDLGDPTHHRGYWSYEDTANRLSLGQGPATKTIRLQVKYNTIVIPFTQGGAPAEMFYNFWVYQVLPRQDTVGAQDIVNANTACTFDSGTGYVYAADPVLGSRDLATGFRVNRPGASTPTEYWKITVGLIQTVADGVKEGDPADTTLVATADSSFGSVKGTTTQGGSQPATLHLSSTTPPPTWDGLALASACYYGANAVQTCVALGIDPYVSQANLILQDNPNTILDEPNFAFTWGVITGITRAMNGTWFDLFFEDMLSASSSDCPGIVIPIYGFKVWEATIAGSLNTTTNVWTGGGVKVVSQNTWNAPVSEIARGTAMSFLRRNMTTP